MLFSAFLTWWYGRGWLGTLDQAAHRMKILVEVFSVPILLKTLFSPWKQIVAISTNDQPLNMRMRAVIDNIISRIVGFWVRVMVLLGAGISLLIASVIGLAWIVIWPLLPLMIPVVIVLSTGLVG